MRFEDAVFDHVGFMRDQSGFVGHQAAGVVSGGCSYINIGWWRSPADFTVVRQSATFLSHAAAFNAMVDVVVVPAANLRRSVPSSRPFSADQIVALQFAEITGDPRRVLASWTAQYRKRNQEPDDSAIQTRNLGYAVSRVMTDRSKLVVLTWWDGPQELDARLAGVTPPGLVVNWVRLCCSDYAAARGMTLLA